MRILTVTSLYPSAAQPQRGLFVRERLRRLQQYHRVEAAVVAPVPWFPFKSDRFGEYGVMARAPAIESAVEGMVYHPRYVHVPKVSDVFSPLAFAIAVVREIRRRRIEFDVIDAHFLFPDGVAAVLAARWARRPVLLSARGSDINLIAHERIAGRWIRWALRRADGLIGVSCELVQELRRLSGRDDVELITNGVDRDRFCPSADRSALRQRLGVSGFAVLSVGNLIELKGHRLVIDAVSRIADATLFILGDGPQRAQLAAQAQSMGLGNRVHLMGSVPQDRLADYYRAADVLVLASSHEGLPNVVLESLASGTPVVATPTGGAREVLTGFSGGLLCERNPVAIAVALQTVRENAPDPVAVRAAVDRFDWRVCADRLERTFQRLLARESQQ